MAITPNYISNVLDILLISLVESSVRCVWREKHFRTC